MKTFIVIFASIITPLLPLTANASTLKCFTNFWGDDKAQVIVSINDKTGEATGTLIVSGQNQSSAVSSAAIIAKGKYQGFTRFDLGTVKGGGFDGGDLYYSLLAPSQFENQQKFDGILYTNSQDGYGSGPSKVLCSLK